VRFIVTHAGSSRCVGKVTSGACDLVCVCTLKRTRGTTYHRHHSWHALGICYALTPKSKGQRSRSKVTKCAPSVGLHSAGEWLLWILVLLSYYTLCKLQRGLLSDLHQKSHIDLLELGGSRLWPGLRPTFVDSLKCQHSCSDFRLSDIPSF